MLSYPLSLPDTLSYTSTAEEWEKMALAFVMASVHAVVSVVLLPTLGSLAFMKSRSFLLSFSTLTYFCYLKAKKPDTVFSSSICYISIYHSDLLEKSIKNKVPHDEQLANVYNSYMYHSPPILFFLYCFSE